jgi:hypothetical protein
VASTGGKPRKACGKDTAAPAAFDLNWIMATTLLQRYMLSNSSRFGAGLLSCMRMVTPHQHPVSTHLCHIQPHKLHLIIPIIVLVRVSALFEILIHIEPCQGLKWRQVGQTCPTWAAATHTTALIKPASMHTAD